MIRTLRKSGEIMAIKKAEEIKFSKKQILESKKYKNFYVLRELLKENVMYSTEEIGSMLAVYGKVVE
jgi:hypothetical protein